MWMQCVWQGKKLERKSRFLLYWHEMGCCLRFARRQNGGQSMRTTWRGLSKSAKWSLALGAVAVLAAGTAWAARFKTVEIEKYGYKLKIPEQFEMSGKIDKTTDWMYQPGSEPVASSASTKTKKRFSLGGGINIGGVRIGAEQSTETGSESSGGGLEPALSIFVNWVWMPDVDSKTMFDTNLEQTRQNANSPDPDYTDIVVFDKEKGFEWEGYAYAFKEVPKEEDDEIHRWHIKAFGNKSAYTVGLAGTYGQFKEWGPIYEEVVKSFELVPMKN